jgi:protein-disulfide isomerase
MKRHVIFNLALSALLLAPAASNADIADKDFSKAIEKYLSTDSGQEQVGKAIESYFQRRQKEAQKGQEKQAEQDLESQFKNPIKIDVGSSPVKGPANAKITIIEFSDFQCPFCKRGKDTMDEVLKKYPNDVKLAFKQLPLAFHDKAEPAARASLSAGKQGKFWEMHDALFDNQSALSAEFFLEQAKKLGLDIEKFKKDMEADDVTEQIKKDKEVADKNGISGTPGFFVNGVAVRGAYPLSHFDTIIQRWLKEGAK